MPNSKEKYRVKIPEIDAEIEALAQKYCGDKKEEYFRQLFTTIVKLHLDNAQEDDLRQINITLKELRHIFRVFKPYAGKRKVVIFGSHRFPKTSATYKLAQDFSKRMTNKGFMVITGGGGGIMEAGNRGADDQSFAIKIRISTENSNPYVPQDEKMILVNYFFNRKLAFIKESDATVLFPGGFGTLDEGFEVLTLLQTGKCPPRPIVMVDDPKLGYWDGWLKFVKDQMVKHDMVREIDLNLFTITSDIPAAVKEVVDFYRIYHSIRYIDDHAVIRLNEELPKAAYKELNREFKDILVKGKIEPCSAQPAELHNKEFPDLPRLKMFFDHKSFARLQMLVRRINSYA